jgi:hypothetical protein
MPSADINDVWAQQPETGTIENITLPSGQTVNARKVALQDLIVAGVVAESDALSGFVQKNHLSSGRPQQVTQEDAMKVAMGDPKAFGSLMMLIDRVIPHVVVNPVVRLHLVDLDKPAPDGSKTRIIPTEEREPGVIYTDRVPFQDKIYLLSWAVGDLNHAVPFREESKTTVATVANVADVPHPTQRPHRNRKNRNR